MKTRKTTKKAASSLKRKPSVQNSYSVADLRALLKAATGALIAIDHWLDTKVEQMVKNQK
jgi:hypothetical protein